MEVNIMLNLKNVVSTRWWDGLWGGGHTVETDPSQNGWKAKPVCRGGHLLLIGKPGVKGCITALPLATGSHPMVDIALYDQTPEQVLRVLETGKNLSSLDPKYVMLDHVPGWGLAALSELAADMKKTLS